jgi:hypothetical protein
MCLGSLGKVGRMLWHLNLGLTFVVALFVVFARANFTASAGRAPSSSGFAVCSLESSALGFGVLNSGLTPCHRYLNCVLGGSSSKREDGKSYGSLQELGRFLYHTEGEAPLTCHGKI